MMIVTLTHHPSGWLAELTDHGQQIEYGGGETAPDALRHLAGRLERREAAKAPRS